ncbi:MAG: hypothetical protein WC758_00870 [Candidatus Woesearchaeota archaeon]|jgi:hypothetical protein
MKKILIISIIAFMLLFVVACSKPLTDDQNIAKETFEEKSSPEPVAEKISFKEILNTNDQSIKQVRIKGYLQEEKVETANQRNQTTINVNYYIVDDDNSKIRLSLVDPNKIISAPKTEFLVYFVDNGTTKNTFIVEGELQWNFEKPIIYVSKMTN